MIIYQNIILSFILVILQLVINFNSSRNKAEYVGYQYIEGQQHGYGKCDGTSASCIVNGNTVYNSIIKQAIDKWYAGTTLKDNDLIADQIFCNDRSASSTQTAAWTPTGATYYYGAYGRLINKKEPQLTCPTASDKFTVNTSNGNGALTYPVGLITADEVNYAGSVFGGATNTNFYLYTSSYYWTMTPSNYNAKISIEYMIYNSGHITSVNVGSTLGIGVRPVINLSKNVTLSGNGTYNSVYTVS